MVAPDSSSMPDLAAEAEALRQAMSERPSVDVAKGVLMALYGYDEARAFTELREVADREGVVLADLAVAVVELASGHGADTSPGRLSARAMEVADREWGSAVASPSVRQVLGHWLLEYLLGSAATGARHTRALLEQSLPVPLPGRGMRPPAGGESPTGS